MGTGIRTYESAWARGLRCIQFSKETFEHAWSDFLWWQNDDNDVKTCVKVISCSHAIDLDGIHHLTIYYTSEYE